MDYFLVKTNSSHQYVFQAHHFHIVEGIVHFYDDEGEVVWVIRDWISFRREDENILIPENPDEFFDNLEKNK